MTVATNALLEGRGARTAFVATEGFTDLVALGRQDRPQLYRLCAARPAPLAPDELRFGAPERMTPDGPLTELTSRGGHRRSPTRSPRPSPRRSRSRCCTPTATPSTSARSARRSRKALPDAHISLSHEVVGTFREFERAATTEIDAALSPLLASYLRRLARARERGRPARAGDHAVQRRPDRRRGRRRPRVLDGAVRPGRRRRGRRVRRAPGRRAGRAVPRHGRNVVRRVRGRARRRPGAEQRRDRRAARWRCRCSRSIPSAPAAARSPGATPAARLRVGPRSAGADPGPACYGRGGTEPTVTDANLVLGYLSADAPLGGGVELDLDAAEQAVGDLADAARPRRRRLRRGNPPRRRRRDDPGAAGGDRAARDRPAPLRADGVRRRRRPARRRRSPTSSGSTRSSARARRGCSRRSGWSSPRDGATCSAACC